MRIDHVEAKQILDTRGRATLETTLLANTLSATASVPSGKSTGSHEALELRDPDGSVAQAIGNVNGEIAKAIVGRRFDTPGDLDAFLIELDGTPNKSRLGANAILSVSIAAMRLSAFLQDIPLWSAIAKRGGFTATAPRLYVNVMNGGAHADFKLPFQEYLLVIEGKTSEAFPLAQELFAKLGELLSKSDVDSNCRHLISTNGVPMGDEGGYAPTFDTIEKPFEILSSLIAGHPNVSLAIDAAASELLHGGVYQLLGKSYSPDELATLYRELVERFPIHSIEDPFAENAPDDFAQLNTTLGQQILIIGDDLTVTDPVRIKDAAEHKAINAVLIKPNQIGTVREALEAVKETYVASFQAVASHRSGETGDTFIADFAYGVGAHGLKAGGFAQKERLVKYERLMAIERETAAV
ncbi:MAG: phosphopyruvate hydratase [Candidatus Paceibacterota bacterium]|jgi:enolase